LAKLGRVYQTVMVLPPAAEIACSLGAWDATRQVSSFFALTDIL